MRRTSKALGVVAAGCVLTLLGSGLAYGDYVVNTLDTTVDPESETMNLTLGGGSGTTKIFVMNQNQNAGDTNTACNLAGQGTSVTVALVSDDPSVATVSPAQITLENCGTAASTATGEIATVTITPVGTGTANITASQSAYTGTGGMVYTTAAFAAVVTAANTPPSVSVTGVTDGASYPIGSVPGAGCSVVDAEDLGESASPVVDNSALVAGLGSVTVTCSYTDAGSLTDTDSVTYTISPPANTAPVVSVVGPEDGATYEIGSVPVATCSVTDAEDTDESAIPDVSSVTHGIGEQTVTCTYTDAGGLIDTDSVTYTIVDTGDPTISHTVDPTSPGGSNGWYVTAPTVTFACDDAGGSGIQSCVVDGSGSPSSTLAESATEQTVNGTATDWAGNTATDSVSGLKVDLSDPVVTCPTAPAFILGQAGMVVTAGVDDLISGETASTATGSADTTSVGPKTVNVTGHDNAGRSKTVACAYSVIYSWTGFFQPIDTLGGMGKDSTVTANTVFNKAKAGSSIPVKFSLGGNQGLGIFAAGYPRSTAVTCSTAALVDALEELSTASTSGLKYDGSQYVYAWKTATAFTNSCQRLEVKLIDGTSHYAFFTFTK